MPSSSSPSVDQKRKSFTLAALSGVILLSGCTSGPAPERTKSEAHTSAPIPAATRTPTPTPPTEAERLEDAVTLDVNLYGTFVCDPSRRCPTPT